MTVEAFPKFTIWWPYWAGADLSRVDEISDDMLYMQANGVVLMGMEWGAHYALPADVSAKLDIFIGKGIKPYLGLWVGKLTDDERTKGLQAWNAGNGKWAGIVVDAEAQWVNHCKTIANGGVGTTQAKADFDGFMAIFRPLTNQLAVATYSAPNFYPNYHYDWWNEVVDTFLPQAYFDSPGDTASSLLTTMYSRFASVEPDWTSPPKTIVPIMNGYSSTMSDDSVVQRSLFMDTAIANSGSVHLWRWIVDFPDNMRQMLNTYGGTTGGGTGGGGGAPGDLTDIVAYQRGTVAAATSILHPVTHDPLYVLGHNTTMRINGITNDGLYRGVVARTAGRDSSNPKIALVEAGAVTNIHMVN